MRKVLSKKVIKQYRTLIIECWRLVWYDNLQEVIKHMSNGTNFYKFQSTAELVDYLGEDLKRIAYCIIKQNLVCEEQFDKLDSYLIEEHGGKLREVLSDLTGEDIIYDYSPDAGMYFLYVYSKMSRERAFEEVSKWNNFYYEQQ